MIIGLDRMPNHSIGQSMLCWYCSALQGGSPHGRMLTHLREDVSSRKSKHDVARDFEGSMEAEYEQEKVT